jgi:hypothetical protein
MTPHPRPLTEQEKLQYLETHRALIKKIAKGPVVKQIIGKLVLVESENLLTVDERGLVAEVLRLYWLPKAKLRTHWRLRKLKFIEATRKLAKEGVEYGERTEFIRAMTGDNTETLRQFVRRTRKRRRR